MLAVLSGSLSHAPRPNLLHKETVAALRGEWNGSRSGKVKPARVVHSSSSGRITRKATRGSVPQMVTAGMAASQLAEVLLRIFTLFRIATTNSRRSRGLPRE